MSTTVNNIVFEWDDEKNRINKRKHHVSFETAVNVFFDENCIVKPDYTHSDYEDRWKIIGKVDDILFVIFTNREERTRIISARRADKKERSEYYGNGNLRLTQGTTLNGRTKS